MASQDGRYLIIRDRPVLVGVWRLSLTHSQHGLISLFLGWSRNKVVVQQPNQCEAEDRQLESLAEFYCDDGDAAVNPGASEVCDASDTDEDCNGDADDDLIASLDDAHDFVVAGLLAGILVPDSGRCEVLGLVPWKQRVESKRILPSGR